MILFISPSGVWYLKTLFWAENGRKISIMTKYEEINHEGTYKKSKICM